MIRSHWKIYIGLLLISLSAILGAAHYAVFRDAHTLLFYLALDVVFVPVQVLLVTVIIEQLLSEREQQVMLKKLYMVIGAFYSEFGRELLMHFRRLCSESGQLDQRLKITKNWHDKEYDEAIKFASGFNCGFASTSNELMALKGLLVDNRPFMLSLLQNSNLLEHDRFSDLLWAVSHLTEELLSRSDFDDLPPADIEHLHGDINRAMGQLIVDWLEYMKHLRAEYPYLYSLALRTNPFNPDASVIIS